MPAEPAPVITIDRCADGFAVTIEPEQATDWCRTYAEHRDARGWASGIRLTTGWPIRDVTEGAAA